MLAVGAGSSKVRPLFVGDSRRRSFASDPEGASSTGGAFCGRDDVEEPQGGVIPKYGVQPFRLGDHPPSNGSGLFGPRRLPGHLLGLIGLACAVLSDAGMRCQTAEYFGISSWFTTNTAGGSPSASFFPSIDCPRTRWLCSKPPRRLKAVRQLQGYDPKMDGATANIGDSYHAPEFLGVVD